MSDSLRTAALLGLDHGERRIGLALKPAGSGVVLPFRILRVRDEEQAMEEIREIVRTREIEGVIVGLPLHGDPSQAQKVRRFARRLRRGLHGVAFRFVDESLTTMAADERQSEAGFNPRKPSDDRAASIILETYLAMSE